MITSEAEARTFIEGLGGQGAIEKLEALAAALREENERQNLVSRGSLEEVWVRHFADSAQLIPHVPRETKGAWFDLGSGAGFPGLVLAILRPNEPTVLIESRKRRIDWLEAMADNLALQNCVIEGKRLELVETRKAAVISARAFAPLPKLLNLSSRFSTVSTYWVLPKGRSAAQEVSELPRKTGKMFHVEQSQTDPEAGIVVGKGKIGTGK
ncbi:16S rRNA (guanine(527)-N(7))-methyltransferase RsmG [Qipengyuania gelatinilytica]|uniref:Ribosomal RNA small subunit methyltransferase G n=1 Tax=Qipengyuania gelatinilytica TaxID=2867231 RepID=A0ABX9A1W4_9SPHN|nr:16S rRNA (guanine(527)-N(7))-methyltransferase RsmG [Qipengyuania gelatinilytica]QZD94169.1 16S rRNA (guanine(527)-N(7))-methyltransferase RsmG [Qipengyuania gelatinilytica]